MFNIAFLYETLIVLGFWAIILPGILIRMSEQSKQPHDNNLKDNNSFSIAFVIVAGGLDHSLPMIVLAIDFSFNCIPFIWRHFAISLTIGIIYLIMNMFVSLF